MRKCMIGGKFMSHQQLSATVHSLAIRMNLGQDVSLHVRACADACEKDACDILRLVLKEAARIEG